MRAGLIVYDIAPSTIVAGPADRGRPTGGRAELPPSRWAIGQQAVGIYVGDGLMIDAPDFGGVVRVEPVYWAYFVGAVRVG